MRTWRPSWRAAPLTAWLTRLRVRVPPARLQALPNLLPCLRGQAGAWEQTLMPGLCLACAVCPARCRSWPPSAPQMQPCWPACPIHLFTHPPTHCAGDLWSLGVVLFVLLSGSHVPFGNRGLCWTSIPNMPGPQESVDRLQCWLEVCLGVGVGQAGMQAWVQGGACHQILLLLCWGAGAHRMPAPACTST